MRDSDEGAGGQDSTGADGRQTANRSGSGGSPREGRSGRKRRSRLWLVIGVLVFTAVVFWQSTACSPIYVIKAGWAEAKILRARQPIPDVILSPDTDERTRGKLTLAREARFFAQNELGLNVGDSYTTFSQLESDTLAMVLSAAYQDRLSSRTWWFPIVGHVPYRGFFDLEDALSEQRKLEREGFDTYLRPTSAFSTLGWFSDPLLSTIVRHDEVELVTTIIHELSHNHLFVPGHTRFNESFATWVGRAGARAFFCTRQGGGPESVWCLRASARWEDTQVFSVFIDELVSDLEKLYGDPNLTSDEKVHRREAIFVSHQRRFGEEVQPRLRSLTFGSFTSLPLNNATLLSRMRYYHRLPDFDSLLIASGGLAAAVQDLSERLPQAEDPFSLLSDAH